MICFLFCRENVLRSFMYKIGQKIIYGENGVCTVEKIAPLNMSGTPKEKLYYHLTPPDRFRDLFYPG